MEAATNVIAQDTYLAESDADGSSRPFDDQLLAEQAKESKNPQSKCTSEYLGAEVKQLVEELNSKRKRDSEVAEDFRKGMEFLTEKTTTLLDNHMFGVYESHGERVQCKLQELFSTLDLIETLEKELKEFRNSLGFLYQDFSNI